MSTRLLSTGERAIEHLASRYYFGPRLRTHSNVARWDQRGFEVERLRSEGLSDTEIARLLHVIPRTVKARRARVS